MSDVGYPIGYVSVNRLVGVDLRDRMLVFAQVLQEILSVGRGGLLRLSRVRRLIHTKFARLVDLSYILLHSLFVRKSGRKRKKWVADEPYNDKIDTANPLRVKELAKNPRPVTNEPCLPDAAA